LNPKTVPDQNTENNSESNVPHKGHGMTVHNNRQHDGANLAHSVDKRKTDWSETIDMVEGEELSDNTQTGHGDHNQEDVRMLKEKRKAFMQGVLHKGKDSGRDQAPEVCHLHKAEGGHGRHLDVTGLPLVVGDCPVEEEG
jgi:hypothetical protein